MNDATLPSLAIEQRLRLPKCPAVYFVVDGTHKIYYIGSTGNLRERWINHHRLNSFAHLAGVSIAWLEVHASDIKATEEQLIDGLRPPMNWCGPATESRRARGLPDPLTIAHRFGPKPVKPRRLTFPAVTCFRCDNQWIPKQSRPDRCARCNSLAWDDPNVPRATRGHWIQ